MVHTHFSAWYRAWRHPKATAETLLCGLWPATNCCSNLVVHLGPLVGYSWCAYIYIYIYVIIYDIIWYTQLYHAIRILDFFVIRWLSWVNVLYGHPAKVAVDLRSSSSVSWPHTVWDYLDSLCDFPSIIMLWHVMHMCISLYMYILYIYNIHTLTH